MTLYHEADVNYYGDYMKTNEGRSEGKYRSFMSVTEVPMELKGANVSDCIQDPHPPLASDGTKHSLYRDLKFESAGVKALAQATSYAAAMMQQQHRTFCFVLLFIGTKFRIFRWDRAGAIVTRAVDYKTDPQYLVEFLWRLSNATTVQLGYDMTRVDATSEEQEKFKSAIRKNVLLQNFDATEADVVNRRGAQGKVTAKEVEVEMGRHIEKDRVAKMLVYDEVREEFRHCFVSKPLVSPENPAGRSTRPYWAAMDTKSDDEWRAVFLKDSWRVEDTQSELPKEGETYVELHKEKNGKGDVDNVPHVIAHGDVLTRQDGDGIPESGSKKNGDIVDECEYSYRFFIPQYH